MPRSLPSPPKIPTFSFSGSPAGSSRARRSARASSLTRSASSSPTTCSSAVPFSWEQSPGIPKPHSGDTPSRSAGGQPVLPLPPPIRSLSDLPFPRKKRHSAAYADPFAAAFTQCAKDVDMDLAWEVPPPKETPVTPRRAGANANRFRLFHFHGSCAALDTTVCLQTRFFCLLSRWFSSGG